MQNIIDNINAISFNPLLDDGYQYSMAKALNDIILDNPSFDKIETFELFFRKNPFNGTFAIAGGIDDALRFISNWKFTENDMHLMKIVYGTHYDDNFYQCLMSLNSSELTVYSVRDGDVVFANEPLIRITGNAIKVQLLETTLLNLIGHPTLVATIAARIKLRSPQTQLFEFGCRRAQGSIAALNSARYSYIGGFDTTSNILAGAIYGIQVAGTHAHSFVMRVVSIDEISETLVVSNLIDQDQPCTNFKQLVLSIHTQRGYKTNLAELGSFIQYAYAYPSRFLALIDTYNTLESGINNYCSVAIALITLGYVPMGVRLDSGDLAQLSIAIDKIFQELNQTYPQFGSMIIVASNDLDEKSIIELNRDGSKCKVYGIGTNLATSKAQPSLGCVYKLVERGGVPRIKKSEESGKTTIPCSKYVFRLFDNSNKMLADLMLTHLNISEVASNNVVDLYNPKSLAFIKTIKFHRYEQLLKPMVSSNDLDDLRLSTQEAKMRCNESIGTLEVNHTRIDCPEEYIVAIDFDFRELIHSVNNC